MSVVLTREESSIGAQGALTPNRSDGPYWQ